ncbi:peptidase M16 [Micractinium conductrix]|uniref:Peptidase M16 n=1 Tax=Micractinium conductrix TaxID=554055 RepID=A0A2P6V9R8_9CHLO|nr:peptidase M16 [Micractinium conductrix]|eukprot:PSC70837.1 peptidase M16 [Micractinium conductrix]
MDYRQQAASGPPAGSGSGGGGGAGTEASCSAQPAAPSPSRRGLLAGVTVGGLYAVAGRSLAAADAAADAAVSAAGDGGGGAALDLLQRQLDQRLTEFTLPNGLRFLVYQRHAAPIVSFHTYADVGAFDEVDGQTGLAHLLEHMAFKGTPRVGTRDYRREAVLLDSLDEVFYSLQEAGGPREVQRLQQQLAALQKEAAELSIANAYGALVSQEGGVGLNAATSHDATKYYVSLPANKAELFFALESERFRAPVFRELYSEKAVVFEERRLRVDNSPLGPFSEQFALRSLGNNYRRPVIGFPEDLERLGRREVAAFHQQHYGPRSLTIAVAGDIRPSEVRRLAEKYFGGWEQPASSLQPSACAASTGSGSGSGGGGAASAAAGAAAQREGLATPATPRSEWEYRAASLAGPAVMHAYFRPCINSPDAVPLDLASDILSGSRSSRLYRSLVLSGKALAASTYSSYPAEKFPSHFVCYAVPPKGSTLNHMDEQLSAEVAALAGGGPTADELRRYKKAARVELLGALGSNSATAAALASYQVLTGDWANVLRDLRRIEGLGGGEVRDAAARWLQPSNVFKGFILSA